MTVSRVGFIDSRVADYQLIVAALPDGTDWFLINADDDGLVQMAQVLSGYAGLQTIDVISHGRPGALTLGSSVLDAASLDAHALQMQQIGTSLTGDGDIMLYGCDVGAGAAGQAFVERFAALTGAGVAASADTTGAGGDWVLESTSGVVEAAALDLSMYPNTLDTITGTSGNDSLVGTVGDDTLVGGAGFDTLDGGTGTDMVRYNSPMAGYRFGYTVSGDIAVTDTDTVTGGNDAVDTLRRVERVVFSDGVVTLRQYVETRINTTTDSNQSYPAITALADGGYVVTWMSVYQDGSGYGIYAQRYDINGSAVGAEMRINTTTDSDQSNPAITALADGGYVVTWMSPDGSGSGIYAQRYDINGSALGVETRINTTTDSEQPKPAITALADGGYVVTWMSYNQDGSGYGIYAQRFDINGSALGAETRINTTTNNDQYVPAITALADGGYVVTWTSYGQDGSLPGVYAQRFDVSGNTLKLSGDSASNTLTWFGATPITLAGLDGNDTLTGGGGKDFLDGGAGVDSMVGGGGDDIYLVDDTADVVAETTAQGMDTVKSSVGFTLSTNVEALILLGAININGTGSADANTITGNSGNNGLSGAGGNDTLYGGGGTDSFAGGTGDDTFFLDSVADVVTENASEGTDTVYASLNYTLAAHVENLVLTANARSGTGNVEANAIYGTGEADTLSGAAGDDTLDGGAGTDTVHYDSSMAGYRFGSATHGDIAVTDTDTLIGGNDGVDTLDAVERVEFSDGVVTLRQYNETRINTTTDSDQYQHAITALADGGYVVTWMSQDGSGWGIYAQRYDINGSAVGAETRINTTTDSNQHYPAITALADGGYVVTWMSHGQDGSGSGIYAQRYDINGSAVGAETRINTTTASDQYYPAITALADGGYVVTWMSQGQDGDSYGIYADRYDAAGVAYGETRINTTTASDQYEPAITALADGGYVVTWISRYQDGSGWGIYAQRYDINGSALGAETRINTATDSDQYQPAITALADGGYVVTWQSRYQDGSSYGIYAQRFDSAGTAVGAETRINTTTADTQEAPAIMALADGGYVVTWTSFGQDGSGYGVYAQRYDLNGSALGAETRINTTTDSNQYQPAITALADGGYVVTWMSQDGSGWGIYAQRFDASGASVKLTGDTSANSLTWSGSAPVSLDGIGGNDTLTGGDGSDLLQGGLGNDLLSGGPGNDALAGGADDDTYDVDSLNDTVAEKSNEGIDLIRSGISYVLPENVEYLTLVSGLNLSGTGNALANTIIGNAASNTLDGGVGADMLSGGAGDDTYVVDNIGDSIVELLSEGSDAVYSSVSYTLTANVEILRLTGSAVDGAGNELDNALYGTAAANSLIGAAGNDSLDGGAGADTLNGGSGDDTYIVDDAGDVVTELAGEGTDRVESSINWALSANIEELVLTGTSALIGTGSESANTITGNAGSNTLDGGAGADTLNGGSGDDVYIVEDAADVVSELIGEGMDRVESSVNWTLAANVEQLVLTGSDAIAGTGSSIANTITGNSGANALDGGTGADTLNGGAGDDTYIVDDSGDVVTELAGEGTDRVESSVDWTLAANVEQLVLLGTSALTGTGNSSANTLTGNSADNNLQGLSGKDTLFGGAGADTLNGGTGADSMAGGAGDDVYFLDAVGDVIKESAGEGTDVIRSALSRILPGNVEQLVLTGSANVNGTGNADANVITGNTGNNSLSGGAGSDTLFGGQGNDTLLGGADADSMVGGAGDDNYTVSQGDKTVELAGGGTDTVNSGIAWTLAGNVENLVLTGTAGVAGTGNALANVIRGNDGGNRLLGQDGADTLAGGLGNDTLTGGAGADVFLFDTALNASSNRDSVIGFVSGTDKIQLDDDIFSSLTGGVALTSLQFLSGAGVTSALTSDHRLIYNTTTGELYYDADGAGGVGAVQFAVLGATTHPTLSLGDFVIVG